MEHNKEKKEIKAKLNKINDNLINTEDIRKKYKELNKEIKEKTEESIQ